jgi:hypothetical protein
MTNGPLAIAPNGANALLGRGKVYADRLTINNDGSYSRTGEFDLGNCTAFDLEPAAEVKELYESMDAASELYARAVTRQTFKIKITGSEFALFNVANVLMGNQDAVTTTAAAVAGQTLTTTPKGGAWYGLGDNVRGATAIVVQTVAAPLVPLVAGTDYNVDPDGDRIQLIAGSAAYTSQDTLTVNYTTIVYTLNRVVMGSQPQIDMFIRFKGNPVKGPKLVGQFWHVQFTPSGTLGLIADDYGNWSLEGMVIADNIGHPTDPNGIVQQVGFA